MTGNALQNIEQIESSLWEAADQLRANSKLTSSEYAKLVLSVIFLRHAADRFYADRAAGRMPRRPLVKADFTWQQHIVRGGADSGNSGARITRRLGVA